MSEVAIIINSIIATFFSIVMAVLTYSANKIAKEIATFNKNKKTTFERELVVSIQKKITDVKSQVLRDGFANHETFMHADEVYIQSRLELPEELHIKIEKEFYDPVGVSCACGASLHDENGKRRRSIEADEKLFKENSEALKKIINFSIIDDLRAYLHPDK